VPEDQDPQPVVQHARSPLREISPPPEPVNPPYNDDANLEPRRRKVPSTSATQVSTASSSTLVPSNTSVSPYFSSSSNSTSTGLNGFNLNLTLAQASQAPQPPADDNDDDDEALFSHFENIDLFVAAEENNENIPPPASSSVVTSATSSSSNPAPFTSIAGPSSSSTKSKISPIPRPLIQEDSIEIVSFTPGLTQIIKGSQNKGKNKEKDPSTSSTNHSTRPNEDSIDLDPDIHTNLDEIQIATYSDPEFLRQQREELARHNASQTARVEKGKGKERDVMMTMRPIKPLPRRSLSSQPQTTRDNNVIEIESDDDDDAFFSDVSPPPPINPARRIPLFVDDSDDDEDINYDDDDDDVYQDEDEYDKENMPVMTRHVKRKVTTTQGGELTGGTNTRRDMVVREVIELSDED
jgi:RecQ-mediated genome instability protein 1